MANRQNSASDFRFDAMADYVHELPAKSSTVISAPPLKYGQPSSMPAGSAITTNGASIPQNKKKAAKAGPEPPGVQRANALRQNCPGIVIPDSITLAEKATLKNEYNAKTGRNDIQRANALRQSCPGIVIPDSITREEKGTFKKEYIDKAGGPSKGELRAIGLKKRCPNWKGIPNTLTKSERTQLEKTYKMEEARGKKAAIKARYKAPGDDKIVAQQEQQPLPQAPLPMQTHQNPVNTAQDHPPAPVQPLTHATPPKSEPMPQSPSIPTKLTQKEKLAPPSDDRRAEVAYNLRPGASRTDPIAVD